MFKIEILQHCKICGEKITGKRCRTFCSKKCRTRSYTMKYKKHNAELQRKRMDRKAQEKQAGKLQCFICGRWYKRVIRHANQRHGVDKIEYKDMHGLPHKRGVISEAMRERLRDYCKEWGMDKQVVEAGKKTRFIKGDTRAKLKKLSIGFKSVGRIKNYVIQ